MTEAQPSPPWIDWRGGGRPIKTSARVAVKTRIYEYANMRAGDLNWTHVGVDADIIAYRVVSQ